MLSCIKNFFHISDKFGDRKNKSITFEFLQWFVIVVIQQLSRQPE